MFLLLRPEQLFMDLRNLISFEILDLVLLALALCALAIQIGYYLLVYAKLAFYRPQEEATVHHPVSVIICARNEFENLRKNIYAVLDQTYPEFEVIIVNDCSWDETEEFLEKLELEYPQLKVVTIVEQEKYKRGKKFALTLGIKAAKHNHLLLTDADCHPAGRNWLNLMQQRFTSKTEIVLGYGPYKKEKGFLNKLIRYDAFFVGVQYLSFALAGKPYMGVGRNLAYTKELFFRHKGFASHNHIKSGDDDLFVNQAATTQNVNVQLDLQSMTYSEPKKNFSTWVVQKIRHFSTAKNYRKNHRSILVISHLSHALFYVALIALLVFGFHWQAVCLIYSSRLLIQLFILNPITKQLGERDLLVWTPLMDALLIFLHPIIYTAGKFIKDNPWK